MVVLVDLRRGVGEQDQQLLAFLEAIEKPVLVVFTKADKLKGNERRNQIRRVADDIGWTVEELLVVSAEKNEGMDRLRAALAPYVG